MGNDGVGYKYQYQGIQRNRLVTLIDGGRVETA